MMAQAARIPRPEALGPLYNVCKRLYIHPEILLVLMHNPELDEELTKALRLAEGK
jgi:hypothetical protein